MTRQSTSSQPGELRSKTVLRGGGLGRLAGPGGR